MEDEQIRRMVDERLREWGHGNGEGDVKLVAKVAEIDGQVKVSWQAFIDLRGVVENGFAQVNRRLDQTNGSIANLHTWRDRSLGALAVLSLIVTTFGATALVLAAGK